MLKRAAIALCLVATPALAEPKTWTNSGAETLQIVASPAPPKPVVVEMSSSGRALRALPYHSSQGGLVVTVPPHGNVQLWARNELAGDKDEAFAKAARYGAFPFISVGPMAADDLPWQTAPGRFRAYPEGSLPVTVSVRNDGATPWKNPRVRLFAPDTWTVAPAVASFPDGRGRPIAILKPGAAAVTTLAVRIPSQASLNTPSPLVAFLRFETNGQAVTVANNIEVTVQEPIDRRYAMTERGDRFAVRLINHFKPAGLGTPSVEIRKPIGADWTIAPPPPVEIKPNAKSDVDAKAAVTGLATPGDQVSVPVVVTLNGYRMGYTPVICVTAIYNGPAGEKGLKRLPVSSPTSLDAAGLTFADVSGGDHTLALDVPEKFATSDPTDFVSPTWVTVDLTNKGATRIRLEYDAWDTEKPTLAADMPVTAVSGEDETFSFVLPDARFGGKLPGKADLRLIVSGGNVTIRKISVTKWNPLKAESKDQ